MALALRITRSPSSDIASARWLLTRTVSWIRSNRDQFSLALAVDAAHRIELIKPLGELALAAELLTRHAAYRHVGANLLAWCWAELDEGQGLLDLLSARPDLLVVATILGGFRRRGFRSRPLEGFIRYVAGTRYRAALQLPNWRALDLQHALTRLGVASRGTHSDVKRTWCSRLPEPWLIDHDSAYAFTHEVFYITDFGRFSGRLPKATREYIRLWLPAWLSIYERKHDLDVYCELLMVAACTTRTWGLRDAFACCTASFDEHGYLPSPEGGGRNLLRRGMSAERKKFLNCYHTTLVGMLAALLCVLQRPNRR